MKKVLLKGPVLSRSGYGEQTRFALRSLRTRPELFDVYLLNIPWGRTGHVSEQNEESDFIKNCLLKTAEYVRRGGQFDISVQVTVPNEFEKIAPVNIGYTAGIETNKVSPQWIQKSNATVDKVIVVSNHSKKIFLDTKYTIQNSQTGETTDDWGLQVPVEAVNYPVRIVDPEPLDIDITTNNNFLVVSQWGVRKNLENTIRWFVQQFEDDEDVGLIVKTNTASDSIMDREFTAARLTALLGENPNRKCKVYLVHGELSPSQLTWLYQHETMKALINIGHGEGFGLPLFEAAYNGLPLITIPWSGQMDFICKPNKKGKKYPRVARVDFDIKQVQPEAVWDGVVQKDSMWAYAKEQSYKRVLKDVLEKQTHYRKEAEALKNYILEEFTEEKMLAAFAEHVYNPSEEELEWMQALDEIEIL
jgi:glycosyltransferase involved in cell wall biosynthesis